MKMMLILAVCVLIVSGCATVNRYALEDVNLQGGEVIRQQTYSAKPNKEVNVVSMNKDGSKTLQVTTEPYRWTGVYLTEALKKLEVTLIETIFRDDRFGEWDPRRASSPCIAVADGKEPFCQAVLYRIDRKDGYYREIMIIEGKASKVLSLSTKASYAYAGEKKLGFDEKLKSDGKLRRKMLNEFGTPGIEITGERKKQIIQEILSWRQYSAPEGTLLSPLSPEQMRSVAGTNVREDFWNKFADTADLGVNPIALASPTLIAGPFIGLIQDVLRATKAPSRGWDFESEFPRREEAGFMLEAAGYFRRQALTEVVTENERLHAQLNGQQYAAPAKAVVKEAVAKPAAQPKKVAKKAVAAVAPKRSKLLENLKRLGYVENVAELLENEVKAKRFQNIEISNGEEVSAMLKGDGLTTNVRLRWKGDGRVMGKKYVITSKGDTYAFLIIPNETDILVRP